MKQINYLAALFLAAAPLAAAAGVAMERLQDFDREMHAISVNVEVEVAGNCHIDPVDLEQTFAGLLGVLGFRTATVDDSHLEFAVSIKGLEASAGQPCGIRQLSMVRQIPDIRMLRIPPGSDSTRYRLWTVENIVTTTAGDIQPQLREQARKDVVAFTRALSR